MEIAITTQAATRSQRSGSCSISAGMTSPAGGRTDGGTEALGMGLGTVARATCFPGDPRLLRSGEELVHRSGGRGVTQPAFEPLGVSAAADALRLLRGDAQSTSFEDEQQSFGLP
jgi:hypothetical protein